MDSKKGSLWWELTALWAFIEVTLGGLLHALRIPFTGIVVGGGAVAIISVIGYFSDSPFKTILKSTLIVMIVKAGASPHSPIPAYLAVGFQGLFGALVYSMFRFHTVATVLFAVICMLESALQKILTLTIMYGMAIWEAIDAFTNKISNQFYEGDQQFSYWIAFAYVTLYGLWGLYIGGRMSNFPNKVVELYNTYKIPKLNNQESISLLSPKKNNFFWLIYFIILALMTTILLLLDDDKHNILFVLMRSLAAVVLIFAVINPIFKYFVTKRAKNSKNTEIVKDMLLAVNGLKQEYQYFLNQLPKQFIIIKHFKAIEILIAFRIKKSRI